jgi:hypothetical protein
LNFSGKKVLLNLEIPIKSKLISCLRSPKVEIVKNPFPKNCSSPFELKTTHHGMNNRRYTTNIITRYIWQQ